MKVVLGYLIGGVVGSLSAGLTFLVFVPLGDLNDGRNHAPEAFVLTILVMFLAGGFVWSRVLRAEALSDLAPPIVITLLAVMGLGFFAGLSFLEILPFFGFTTFGIATTLITALLFKTRRA